MDAYDGKNRVNEQLLEVWNKILSGSDGPYTGTDVWTVCRQVWMIGGQLTEHFVVRMVLPCISFNKTRLFRTEFVVLAF